MAITWCAAMSDGCLLNSVAVVALPIAMVSRPNGYRVVPQWLCCYGDGCLHHSTWDLPLANDKDQWVQLV